ncbi:MAG: monovalent cation/H(+) antiporter subunit G [bacterium]|nr:monovalent cation/H(+) antiporter subunit G [bacterium]
MIDLLTILLIGAGYFFFFATTVGILRLPDFYCRMHAAGKGDILASRLIFAGRAL